MVTETYGNNHNHWRGDEFMAQSSDWAYYDVGIMRNVRFALSDGVQLAMDVYLPRGPGSNEATWPVIVERTPYGKHRTDLALMGKFFAAHGYAVCVQDVRGRFESEGEWYGFGNEGPDGFETVEWIRRQPWCDGRVATVGLSYSSCTQTSLAALAPTGLTAQFISQGHHNYHSNSMRHHGALEQRFLIYAFRMAQDSREALANPVLRDSFESAFANIEEYIAQFPLHAGTTPLRLLPSYEQWALDIQSHGDYDQYWKRPGYSIEELYDNYADVPIHFLGSWYDSYGASTVRNYRELSRRLKSPVRLIMGPWIHGGSNLSLSYSGDVEFGPDAALPYNLLRLRWFDEVVRGKASGLTEGLPVRIFVMGGGSGLRLPSGRLDHGGQWRDEKDWPVPEAVPTDYYLHESGELSPEPPSDFSGAISYRYNPLNPVPTIGGNISAANNVMPPGGFDQRCRPGLMGCKDGLPLAARPDVCVFTTPPLTKPMEVTGTVAVTLHVSSSAPDTDFTAKLIDWYPPNRDYPHGYALNIGDSIVRMRYYKSRETAEFIKPGEVYEVKIELYPTSNLFMPGHRIRLDISSSNFPRFDANPNTGEPLGANRGVVVATNTVHMNAGSPSRVTLPVVRR